MAETFAEGRQLGEAPLPAPATFGFLHEIRQPLKKLDRRRRRLRNRLARVKRLVAQVGLKRVADVLDRNKVSGKVVVAMDTDSNTLNWIQKGLIVATIAQKPFTMSHYGVLMLDTLHHFKLPNLDIKWAEDTRSPVPMFVDTGDTLIDKRNVADFLKAQTSAGGN